MDTIKLNENVSIPVLGLGIYTIKDKNICTECIRTALDNGYRSIDTAAIYENEHITGQAVKESGIPREDIIITTKLWVQDEGYVKAKKAIEASLGRLKTDYIDILMIHEPMGDIYGQWKAMEEAYDEGRIKALGVSNMYADRLVDFHIHARIKPVINQIRTNPYFQHLNTAEWMKKYHVVHQAHSPFSQGNLGILEDPVLLEIARVHQKTTAQVILRWLYQRGITSLTRSTKPERIIQNAQIFDFALADSEMAMIKTLDRPDGNSFDNRDPRAIEVINSWTYSYEGV